MLARLSRSSSLRYDSRLKRNGMRLLIDGRSCWLLCGPNVISRSHQTSCIKWLIPGNEFWHKTCVNKTRRPHSGLLSK
jgi:hypothetical protein